MNLTLLLAEAATDGAPMLWWQALLMVVVIFLLSTGLVLLAVWLSERGPRR